MRKIILYPSLAVLFCAAVSTPVFAASATETLRNDAKEMFGPLPDKMPGAENDTPAMIKLGEKLYFDTRLSSNQKMSCNTCHRVDEGRGGVDNEPTSPGAFGKRGDRNSPTVLNAGLHFSQFWDGRATNLEEQAKGPILNPVEMAMPNEAEVLARLNADKTYRQEFAKAFPASKGKVTYDDVARAIAAFERTLVTRDRFDQFQKGDEKALTSLEQQGLKLFMEIGCTTCHNGPAMGANSFQKVGLVHPYENKADLGRYIVTKEEDDKYKFKVPTLRNIAITGPYFHDGKQNSLEEVVKKMAWMQLARELKEPEIKAIAAFLNSLTDVKRAKKT